MYLPRGLVSSHRYGAICPDPPPNRHQAPLPGATHRAGHRVHPFRRTTRLCAGPCLSQRLRSHRHSQRPGSNVHLAKIQRPSPPSSLAQGGGSGPIRLGCVIAVLPPRAGATLTATAAAPSVHWTIDREGGARLLSRRRCAWCECMQQPAGNADVCSRPQIMRGVSGNSRPTHYFQIMNAPVPSFLRFRLPL